MVLKMRRVLTGLERATVFLYIPLVSSCTCPSKRISITKCFANHDRQSIYRKEIEPQTNQNFARQIICLSGTGYYSSPGVGRMILWGDIII